MKHLKNIVILALGIFIIYWAMEHSPEAGLAQKIGNKLEGSYNMSEPWYYASMVVGSLLSIFGILGIYKSR